jgi:hypothetical protein
MQVVGLVLLGLQDVGLKPSPDPRCVGLKVYIPHNNNSNSNNNNSKIHSMQP